MTVKKIAIALLFNLLMLTVVQVQADDGLAKIKFNGTIIFGTEGTYTPYTFHDVNNNLVGFDVDIGHAIAAKLDVKAKFVEGRWDSLIAGLDSKRYDAVISQVGITPERQAKYDFSQPYIHSKIVLITRDNDKTIKGFTDLKDKKSAQSLNSNYFQIASKYGANIIPTDGFNQSIELVLTGRAAATLNDNLSFLDLKKCKPDIKLKVVNSSAAIYTPIGILLRKNQPELVTAINKALDEIKTEGIYKNIYVRYFGLNTSE